MEQGWVVGILEKGGMGWEVVEKGKEVAGLKGVGQEARVGQD